MWRSFGREPAAGLVNTGTEYCLQLVTRKALLLLYYRKPISKTDITMKDVFFGFIRMHILYHASKEPVYGLWLIEELGRHGYRLSPGTLYPMLHALEKERFLKSSSENVSGKIRKYYTTSPKGEKMLSDLKGKIQELMEEVLK